MNEYTYHILGCGAIGSSTAIQLARMGAEVFYLYDFDKVEEPFVIKCDVHPWMKSYVSVFDHPYFAVTDKNGNFKIDNVPPGEYEILAWQEKFKTKGILTQKVTVGKGEIKSDFTFVRKSKKK